MKIRKVIWIPVVIIIVVCLVSSGFVYSIIKDNRQNEAKELLNLQIAFYQQYGSDVVINQLVSPEKVYAISWTGGDGISHISWNIGGLWVTVMDSPSGEQQGD